MKSIAIAMLALLAAAPALAQQGVSVNEIVIGIGRSPAGIPTGADQQRARLLFVIGVPERLVNDYLICVGTLVRLTKDEAIRTALLEAETPRQFLETLIANL